MHIFVDEAGSFTKQARWSVVCSLSLPSRDVEPTRRKLAYISRSWPRTTHGELKGGSLDVGQLVQLVSMLKQRQAILVAEVIDVASENDADLEAHKLGQCDGITKNLTLEHQPTAVEQLWALRRTLERMPLQLYIQCVLMSSLISQTVEHCGMYFSQRRPRELGDFSWIVDAKDPLKITTQETWWRDTLGPLLETRSDRVPFRFVNGPGFDYSYFQHKFRMEKELWRPDRPLETARGFDVKKVISTKLNFVDSRADILLQAVDVLANYLRRLLMGTLRDEAAAQAIGALQIFRRDEDGRSATVHFRTMAQASRTGRPDAIAMIRTMTKSSRPMILKSRYPDPQ